MKINSKKYVNFVPRQPHWLSNRKGYFTMERNERVDEFSNKLMSKIKKELTSFDLRTYPDTDKIFEQPEKEPTYRKDSWDDVNEVALEIIEQIQSFEYEEE